MALKTETKEIGGVTYVIGQVPATRSVKLLARLGRVLGPAIGEIAKLFEGVDLKSGKGIAAADIDLSRAGDVLKALFLGLDDAEIDGLLRELFSNVAATSATEAGGFLGAFEGDLKKIDAHFSGNVDRLFRVLFASLEVNFGGFFDVLAALAPRVAAVTGKAKAGAPSPSSSATSSM